MKRLQRLEKIRAIAKQSAANEAARAESTFAQLSALAERTGQLAADYAARTDVQSGADLRSLNRFAASLQGVRATTQADARRAEAIADRRQIELASAERRRAAVETRAQEQARQIAAKEQYTVLSGKSTKPSRFGTPPA